MNKQAKEIYNLFQDDFLDIQLGEDGEIYLTKFTTCDRCLNEDEYGDFDPKLCKCTHEEADPSEFNLELLVVDIGGHDASESSIALAAKHKEYPDYIIRRHYGQGYLIIENVKTGESWNRD